MRTPLLWAAASFCAVLVLLSGCASDPFRVDPENPARLRHRKLGYTIALPTAEPPGAWRRVDLEGADLALRDADGSLVAMGSSCRKTRARPRQLARKLTIGTPRDRVRYRGKLLHRGDPGWVEIIESHADGHPVRVKTVTVLSAGCVFDWLLVATDEAAFEAALPAFDGWWATFRAAGRTGSAAREPPRERALETNAAADSGVAEGQGGEAETSAAEAAAPSSETSDASEGGPGR